MAEAQHAAINDHKLGARNIKSDLILPNEPGAPSHSRSNSSDSGEGLVLSATDLQVVAKQKHNHSQKAEFNCCDSKPVSLCGMGQTGNSAKPFLEHQKGRV